MMLEEFQSKAMHWAVECFGVEGANKQISRGNRFAEEAMEFVQACGGSREAMHQVVDYVFDRPVGDKATEAGDALMTLALLSTVVETDLKISADEVLERCWANIDKIRAKALAKPKFGPLPMQADQDAVS